MYAEVRFQPAGCCGAAAEGGTLLDAARELGVALEAGCGGAGVCGKCRVMVDERDRAAVSPPGPGEVNLLGAGDIAAGYRLACRAAVRGNVTVTVPVESRGAQYAALETGKDRRRGLNPAVRVFPLELSPASLDDPVDDCGRLIRALENRYGLRRVSIDPLVMRSVPSALRNNHWQVNAVMRYEQELIRILPRTAAALYGAAVDVGTTTLAAWLCDLGTGETVARASRVNPQIRYGADILARISYINREPNGLETLRRVLIAEINAMLDELGGAAGVTSAGIDEVVLVFNTVMHHIALGIDPSSIGRLPFVPAVSAALDIKARDLGLAINPAGYIHTLPIEAGFVGADNVAALIAEEPYKQREVRLIIDIGTNGEIDLGNRERMFAASCATGPALEGAQITFGMRAAPGAIERVRIDGETLEPRYKVIGTEQWYPDDPRPGARGICGSGIIDVIAGLLKAGIIQSSGRMNTRSSGGRVRENAGGRPEYVLAWADETGIGRDIVITQEDVRAIQLAKAAIYASAQCLMKKYGVDAPERVILAGAFGSYIDRENAAVIGLFPDCPLENIEAVGNAAGDGARYALLDRQQRVEAAAIARGITVVETAAEPDFQERFIEALAFPHPPGPAEETDRVSEQVQ
jgi:uncharacterized 2Fe-2S/4Fe-4S cluster protein (DUF4445 family)